MTEEKEGYDYVICAICGKKQKQITHAHLKTHNITFDDYLEQYPGRLWRCINLQKKQTENQIKVQYNNETNKCKMCGKTIQWNNTFCSKQCVGRFKRKPLVESLCLNCKQPFHHLLSAPTIYCSRDCYIQHKVDSNPTHNWLENARKRDSYKCVLCDSYKNIRVHHIDGDNKNNIDKNLITLCESCHRMIHSGLFLTVYKTFTIEIAHHLPNHKTCGVIHGHSMDIEVGVKGPINLVTGMVIDFKDLKKIIQEVVIDKFDHSYLNDTFKVPTAELFAFYIFKKLKETGLNITVVRVHETRDNYAEFKRPLR